MSVVEGAIAVVEWAVAMVEWAVAIVEDLCREEDGKVKTSSCETSGTAGSGPSSKARLLQGQTWTLRLNEV